MAHSQAYLNAIGAATTTPQGYSLSSSYVSHAAQRAQPVQRPAFRPPPTGGWYQPGDARCTYTGCAFTGSKKSVDIHMMDRHLIYPPGWEKRKKKDWDADPSLKGKHIPIQGTNLLLDTPEALDAWIAERKKRWPTANKVDEKKRKVEEAVARGQLDPGISLDGRKRRRIDDGDRNMRGRGRGRGRGNSDIRGRGRGRGCVVPPTQGPSKAQRPATVAILPPKPLATDDAPTSDSDSDSDHAPEAISSKAPAGLVDSYVSSHDEENIDLATTTARAQDNVQVEQESAPAQSIQERPTATPTPIRKPSVPQPKRPPPNMFSNRPSLLRRLLLPEIRMTVSNFSQAIHFLVDNNFLENVELKPGEASQKMIEVIADFEAGAASEAKEAVTTDPNSECGKQAA